VKAVIFDLDSTLSDTQQRHHLSPFVDPTRTWDDYSLSAEYDAPILGTIQLVRMLIPNYELHILTGRRETAMSITKTWLAKHRVPWDVLRMRNESDPFTNEDYKLQYLEQLIARGITPVLFVNDWPEECKVVEEKLGVPTICVNPRYDCGEDPVLVGWSGLKGSVDNAS